MSLSALSYGPARAEAETAVEQLLERATRFRAKGQLDRARVVYERVLRAVPDHPAALVALGAEAARAGHPEKAQAYRVRLERAHPGHDDLDRLQHALRVGVRFGPLVDSARARARAGRAEEAVVLYRQAFGGGAPPPQIALEYYQTLGGTERGWGEGRRGLRALVEQHPTPARRLALARHLTYRPASRREGIRKLRALLDDPTVGDRALKSLRDALLWLDGQPSDLEHYQAFLERRPDPDVRERLRTLRPSAREARARRIAEGFERLAASDLEGAKELFASARADAEEVESLVGLAAVALRQASFTEARELFERARARAPERTELWSEGLATAMFWEAMRRAETALADQRLEPAAESFSAALEVEGMDEERHRAWAGLGFVERARGDAEAAAARFERALELEPESEPGLRGLRDLRAAQGSYADAIALNRRLSAMEAASAMPEGRLEAERQRTGAAKARREGRVAEALRLLKAAHVHDPQNPWVLHDLADLHLAEGKLERARAKLEEFVALAPTRLEARVLRARFEAESGAPARALALLERIPREKTTPELVRLASRLEVEAEVAATVRRWRGGERAEARQVLLRLQESHDLEPDHLAAVATGWSKVGVHERALAALREAIALREDPGPGLLLQLAGTLLGAGRHAELAELLERLGRTPMPSRRERRDLDAIRIAFAVQRADRAREAGDHARAFERLSPLLEAHPEDPALLSALGRLFRSSGRLAEAREVFARMLERDPRDVDAREAAVGTHLALGERAPALKLVEEGLRLEPENPRMALLEARYHVQLGEDEEAMTAFARARRLIQRRASAPPEPAAPVALDEAVAAGEAPAVVQAGYAAFGFVGATAPPRPGDSQRLLQTIEAETSKIRAKYAAEVTGGFELRRREGESGLGLLTEIGGEARASIPFGYSTRLFVRAAPVLLDPGALALGAGGADRFGSLGSIAGAAFSSEDTSVAGAELAVGFQHGGLSGEIGTSPLGFELETVLGALRYEVRLGGLGLAFEGSRRAVTDSLTSWSGVRDPGTNRVWGGVVRQGGRAELSFEAGQALYYAYGGGFHLGGRNVADNAHWLAGLGADWRLVNDASETTSLGIGGLGMGYERNLSQFSLGHGGYFSPQLFLRAGVPFRWRASRGDFRWRLRIDPGINWFRVDEEDWFPSDPDLQAAREASAAAAVYPGRSTLSFSFDAGGELHYAITRGLHAGLRTELHFAEDYEEVTAGLFLRYSFADGAPWGRGGAPPTRDEAWARRD